MIIAMKRFSYFVFTLALMSSALLAGTETFLNKKEKAYIDAKPILNVYVEPDVYSYSYTYDNYLNGYAIHYLRLLAKKLDVDLRFITDITREEAKKRLDSGALDVALFPTFEPLDDNAFQFSKFPIGVLQPALLMPKIYQLSPTLESIEKLRIVMLKDDAFASTIKDKNPDATIEIVNTIEEAVLRVAEQEADLAIGLHEIFTAHLESKMITSLQSIPLRNNADFPMVKIFLTTAKENIVFISILNKAMAEIDYKELVFARNRFFPSDSFRQTNIKVPLSKEEKFFLMGQHVLQFCAIPNSLPYGDIVQNRYEGIGSDVIALLEKNLDIPIQLVPTHSKEESVQKLLSKKCDFIAMASETSGTDLQMAFTSAILQVPLVVLTTDDRLYVSDFKEIADRSFAIQKEHPMIASLQAVYPSLKLTLVNTEIEGLKLVEEGIQYGFITSNFTVSHLFAYHIANNLKVSAQIPLKMPVGFALLAENQLLYSILEQSMQSVLSGEIEHLILKWVPDRSPKGFDYTVILQLVFLFMLFSVIAFILYFEVRLKKSRLEEATQSLDILNHELESRIKKEVEISREKDMVMYRQSRFASMGEMIGNIAHQWRQPLMELSAILMDLQAAIHFKKKVTEHGIIDTINASNRVIQFMSHTIDDFRNFFSPQKELSAFCINEVVAEAINIMKATLHHHRIALEVVEHLPNAMAYGLKNEYAQVIINLISNAKDILTVRAVAKGRIIIEIDQNAEYSKVSVIDNAGGIKDEDFSHIFEPFFTKEKSNGTGIGLFMSRMIIENNMKGIITVGNVDNGVAFCVTVPRPHNV
ncbi:ATPase domain protein [Sulfurospirillum halorespirans DSM 13726]|uniref:histidine kinase n=2 Tax=Sulfurospirillum halorespirans TaxID=194424 RepID=A0A1D7TI20_9BACT|nr:ATPase domain protein [Sulfurospirillum halorespirans DSM 13726]